MEEKRKELVRSALESMGIVIPEEIRKKFEGKRVQVVPDEEWDKMMSESSAHINNEVDNADSKLTE